MIAHSEILNIEYHTIRLMVKALNKHKTIAKAAKALGMAERLVYNKKQVYDIKRVDGEYKMPKLTIMAVPVLTIRHNSENKQSNSDEINKTIIKGDTSERGQ